MKITCGNDIIEIDRIQKAIEEMGEQFIQRIYTQKEISYCKEKKNNQYQHFAARFAAKEAAFKALSYQIPDKYAIEWKSIEVENDEQGKPILRIDNAKISTNNIESLDISISHCKNYAIANVVVLWRE